LKPLERRGLVEVTVEGSDKRSRRLALTDAGRDVLRRAMPIWRQAQAQNEALLNGAAADSVRETLRALS
jgi:DNA-binding MarR family transcriptional regulator